MSGLGLKLWRDLLDLKVQVFTIAILIVGGVSVLISSWSSYQSLQRSKDSYYEHFHFADIFAEAIRAPQSLTNEVRHWSGVERVEARIVNDGLVDVPGQPEPAIGRFISWLGDHQSLNLIYLRQGTLPNLKAGDASTVEAVVHEAFATAHHLKVGDSLAILVAGQKRRLLISGIGLSPEYIYALSPVAPMPDDKHFGVFWVRHSDLEAMTGLSGSFNSLLIKVAAAASINEIKRRLDELLEPFGALKSYDRSRQMSHIFVEDEIRQQKVMAVFMPTIFLSVAMFILNIILSRLVALHRGQIATLKSLGYTATELVIHYLKLVTVIMLVGIGPSIGAGAWIGHWYAGLLLSSFGFLPLTLRFLREP